MKERASARALIAEALRAARDRAAAELGWPDDVRSAAVEVERPKDPEHGDYATNLAMRLAKPLRRPPLEIAEALGSAVAVGGPIGAVEAARPGFVNVRLDPAWLASQADAIAAAGADHGRSAELAGQRIQVEYVSANPTGPMTVANARGGPIGDVLANVLAYAGAEVTREYYVNDSGTQVEQLGRSVALRYRELFGESVTIPEDAYPGEYVVDIARRIRDEDGDRHLALPLEEQARLFAPRVIGWIVEGHSATTRKFGIHFDEWSFESELMRSGHFDETIRALRATGVLEDRDGAVWLRSRELGEDIDSVVIRSSGVPTYFGVDIAYHRRALTERGFDRKIDVWGANTHGHMRRMRTALAALGLADRWEVVLYQYVKFLHEGALVKMAKRSGQFLLLDDVLEAVGVDAARFFLLQSSADRTLDFDFELAVQQSNDNPVYYVQYAHARISSIFRTARERGVDAAGADVSLLADPGELQLLRACLRFPELLEDIREHRGVHLLTGYALELAGLFHAFYRDHRVVGEDLARSKARLRLVEAVRVTLRQTLGLLGIGAPDSM
ncbi:MAG TPA: arginine--tRNA ligase [Candidatus Limnocylindrales bacterium]|nr:arginine--tRNA ligase [Candidatus Limnocylindrales bacterium]